MPHITLSTSPNGLLIDVLVGVSRSREETLKKLSKPVPEKISVRALIDTGASCTCMDSQVVKKLGLHPTGSVAVLTPSTGATPHEAYQYDVSIHIPFPHASISHGYAQIGVVEADLANQGLQALLGRDILGKGLLIYDGQWGTFTLSL